MSSPAESLLEHVRASRRVLLTGPEGPDGDSIGACLALQRLLAWAAPGVRVDVAGDPGARYGFLPGAEQMVPDPQVGHADGVVVMDGDRRRLPAPVAAAFDGARWTALVDHHRSTDPALYTVSVFDPGAESTCGMVYALAKAWGLPIDAELAALLYAGVIFDTGGFRYSNTRASTHLLAAELVGTGIDHAGLMLRVLVERRPAALRLLAHLLGSAELTEAGRVSFAVCPRALLDSLGAVDADLEGVVDHLQHVEGVELAVLVVERPGGKVKVSLRSRGRIDVASLARSLDEGGGGHAKAAGVVLTGGLDEVAVRLRAAAGGAVRNGS